MLVTVNNRTREIGHPEGDRAGEPRDMRQF